MDQLNIEASHKFEAPSGGSKTLDSALVASLKVTPDLFINIYIYEMQNVLELCSRRIIVAQK